MINIQIQQSKGEGNAPSFAVLSKSCTKVAILDTGLDSSAVSKINVVKAKSFVNGDPLKDENGHGTQMIKTLLNVFKCQQRDIEFIIAQTINKDGIGDIQSMVSALAWLIQFRPQIVIIPSGFINEPQKIYPYINFLKHDINAIIIASTGNPFLGQTQSLYPAHWPEVISVGCKSEINQYNTWEKKPDYIIDFSCLNEFGITMEDESTSAACMILGGLILENYFSSSNK